MSMRAWMWQSVQVQQQPHDPHLQRPHVLAAPEAPAHRTSNSLLVVCYGKATALKALATIKPVS